MACANMQVLGRASPERERDGLKYFDTNYKLPLLITGQLFKSRILNIEKQSWLKTEQVSE